MKRLLTIGLFLVVICPRVGFSQRTEMSVSEAVRLAADAFINHRLDARAQLQCDVDVCSDEASAEALQKLIALPRGTKVVSSAIVGTWSRLMRTGYFSEVRPIWTEVKKNKKKKVRLTFQCVGHVIIQDLKVRYSNWASWLYPKQFVTEIRKRLPLRRGGSFPAEGTTTQSDSYGSVVIKKYENRVLDLYRRQGFIGTKVKIRPRYYGVNQKKVDVFVDIEEGEQPEMGQVLIRGAEGLPYWRIVEHLSTGERTDFWRNFFGLFGVGRFARRTLKEELEEVEKLYRKEGWVSARIRLDRRVAVRDKKVYPKVRIVEGRHLTVKFVGNRSLGEGELRQVLTFAESGTFDETEILESVKQIKSLYQSAARYFVQVSSKRSQLSEGRYLVTFVIDEGPRVYAKNIVIIGNKKLAERDILSVMATKSVAPDGVLNALTRSEGIVQDERVINDLTRIRDLYRKKGMPGIKFRCATPSLTPRAWTTLRQLREKESGIEGPAINEQMFRGQYDVWTDNPLTHHCFQVIPDVDSRLVTLRIDIDEGFRTTVGQMDLGGIIDEMDERMQTEARALLREQGFLNEYEDWIENVGFTRSRLKALRGFILRYLHQQGYLSAVVTSACELEDGQILRRDECAENKLYGLNIKRVFFDTRPGPRTQVSGVLLKGNLSTKNSILLDELLLKKNAPLGSDGLFLSQANLRSLGVFSAVNVEYIGQNSSDTVITDTGRVQDRDATVVVTVEENQAKLLEAYFGLQIDSTPIDDELPVLYAGGTTVRHRNFLGRALEIGLGFHHSNRIDQPTDVEGDEAVWRAGPFFKNRRLFGTRLDLAVEALYERGRTSQRDAYQEELNVKATVGFDFYNLSYPSRWGQGLRAALKTEFLRERLRPLTRRGERPLFEEPTESVTISPSLSWDKRDSPLHPTQGWLMSGQAEFVFPDLLELRDLPVKVTLVGQYIKSFFKRQLIFVPNLRIGGVWTERKEDSLQSDFFFKAGGDGVALPIRGYADASVDACEGRETPSYGGLCSDVFPSGVNAGDDLAIASTVGGRAMILGGLEVRFPTFVVDDFWFAGFLDTGAIAPQWTDMDTHRLKTSVGGGVRWLVSGQIPLRLDMAYPLTPIDPFSPQELRVHLNIFYTL